MDKRYYKKKGPSHRDRLRCPLCGKLSSILYFNLDHLFGVYRYRYGGKGAISVTLLSKDATFMTELKQSIAGRLKELLEKFTGLKYFSELEMAKVIKTMVRPLVATKPIPTIATKIIPKIIPFAEPIPIPLSANVIPVKVVIN